jgi:hypothetical protein
MVRDELKEKLLTRFDENVSFLFSHNSRTPLPTNKQHVPTQPPRFSFYESFNSPPKHELQKHIFEKQK